MWNSLAFFSEQPGSVKLANEKTTFIELATFKRFHGEVTIFHFRSMPQFACKSFPAKYLQKSNRSRIANFRQDTDFQSI